MDFFFGTSKVGYYLLAVPKRLRFIFTLTVLLLIATLWFFFIYKPINKTINYYVYSIDQLKTAHTLQEKTIAETALLQQVVYKKQKKLTQCTNNYQKRNNSLNDAITLIFDLASKTKLTVHAHSPQDSVESLWYITHSFKTEFQGSFNNIVEFLDALKKASLPVHMKTFHLHKNDNGSLILICTFNLMNIKGDSHEVTQASQI